MTTNALLRGVLAARRRQPFLSIVSEKPQPTPPAADPTPEVADLNHLPRAAMYGPSPTPADAKEATP